METTLLGMGLFALAVVFVYMFCWFVFGVILKNNGIVDVAWGLGFIVLALSLFAYSDFESERQVLLTMLVIFWGVRLAVHIIRRSLGKPEDFRYANWRKEWAPHVHVNAFFPCVHATGPDDASCWSATPCSEL